MLREWSKYQVDVFDAVKTLRDASNGALMVEAVAGSGKTTTIVESLKLLPSTHQAVFVAFNKHIAAELKRRVPGNVEACTMNSFGFRALRQAYPAARLDDCKTRFALRDACPDPEKRRRWDGAMKRLIGLKKATLRVVCATCDQPDCACDGSPCKVVGQPADVIAKQYDLDLPTDADFMDCAKAVWQRVTAQTAIIDFDDQWALPVLKKLTIPQYDWIFVDEAQDLCSTQIELIKRAAPRIVAVGDPRQAIYGFRGADPDAMDRLRDATQARVLPLSICYRCPRSVVTLAAELIKPDVIESAPEAVEGSVDDVDVKDLPSECSPGCWVLCRTTAPLVRECMRFIVQGKKASVKGRDIGAALVSLVEKVGGTDVVDFTQRLSEWYDGERRRLEAAQRDAQLQALEDRVETLHALAEGARTVTDVIARIDNVFKDEASPGVTFATAHRSKGLEADDVYILRPDLMPFPKAKSEWQVRQEVNLKYVAFTRAMKRLRMVRGGER